MDEIGAKGLCSRTEYRDANDEDQSNSWYKRPPATLAQDGWAVYGRFARITGVINASAAINGSSCFEAAVAVGVGTKTWNILSRVWRACRCAFLCSFVRSTTRGTQQKR